MSSSSLLERARAFSSELVAIRREIHAHPELGFQEVRTAGLVAGELERMGLTVQRGVAKTGIVCEIQGSGPGPVVALRADMDALPIQEETGAEYASTVPGVMHACGHDAHVAALLGAARLLVGERAADRFPAGSVRLLFQPSEEGLDSEGKSGAMRMVEEGAMEGVDAVMALHVWSHKPSGTVHLREGAILAGSDEVSVEVLGRSSHAARPEEGVDALVLAAQGIMAAQAVVSRGISPLSAGVVTFGTISGGVAPNVIADQVRVQGTLRYFDESVREKLREGLRSAFEGAAAVQGGKARVEFRAGYPPLINDSALTGMARGIARELVGEEAVREAEPFMGAEDFAFLSKLAPGAFFYLGAALPDPREHHHPRFDIDESVLPLGAAMLAAGALRILEGGVPVRGDAEPVQR